MIFEIERVIEFAATKHSGQYRKHSGLPYIVHPIAVLDLIGTNWNISDKELWKAAICHDLFEDTETTFEELSAIIGDKSAMVVQELTFQIDPSSSLEKNQQKSDYLKTFREKSVEALVIKFADRCCNTFDFMASESDSLYARKYWKKASDLIDAVFSRSEEIVQKYGVESFNKIKYTESFVKSQLF